MEIMSKYRILKNTGIYTLALILPQIAGFFLLPVYTRILTPADYAVISLVGSFTAIVGIFIALQSELSPECFINKQSSFYMAGGAGTNAYTVFPRWLMPELRVKSRNP